MRAYLSIIVLVCVVFASCAWAETPTTPKETVQAFLDLLSAGDMLAYEYWDVDMECDFIFGDFYRSLSPGEQKRLQDGLIGANQPFISMFSEILAESEIVFLGERALGADMCEVEFWLTSGDDKTYYLYFMHWDGEGWKIIRGIIDGMDLDVVLRVTFLTEWQGLTVDEILENFQLF